MFYVNRMIQHFTARQEIPTVALGLGMTFTVVGCKTVP